jgi:exonuclease VII small subunit
VEALKEKLEWMMAYWARSVQEFEVLRLGKMETVALEEKVPEIEAQYEKMGFGLKRMHGFFDSGSIEELEAGMESVRAAGESLVDLFEFIDHETRPPTSRACLRCGLDNPLEARFCKGCKFPIPDFASKDASSFSFVEEAPAGTGGRVLTSNLARLQEAVEGLESGTYSPEDFVKVLEWMESRTAEGRAQMAGMKMPVEQLADHEREKLAQARALLEAATAHLEEGLALMRRFVQDQDRRHLRDGLEKCLEGGDIFCELYSMAREAQSAAG